METEDQDEAYHSGLTMMSASGESKEEDQQSDTAAGDVAVKKAPGSHPVTGTSSKERSAMNMLFSGKQPASTSSASRDTIKQTLGLLDTPNAVTPTTHLTGQLKDFTLRQRCVGLESPTGEYVSGDYPSLCESDLGYTSMPSMDKPDDVAASLPAQKPQLITSDSNMGEDMEVDRVCSQNIASAPIKNTKEASKIYIGEISSLAPAPVVKNSELAAAASETGSDSSQESSRSLSPAPVSMLVSSSARSESPTGIPLIAEDIEVTTDMPHPSPERRRRRKEGVASKRSAAGLPEHDLGPSTKNPRLSPGK